MVSRKATIITGALAAVALLLAACGGDDDNGGSQTGIRTNKGLSVAAVGSEFDPRLQSSAAEADDAAGTNAGQWAPVPGFAEQDIARSGGFAPDMAPVLQEGGDGITVQGYGTADADADAAIVEFYFFRGGGGVEPQPAPEGSSRSSDGSAGVGIAEPAAPVSDLSASSQEVAQITEADLQPVIDALTGAGVPREDIEFIAQGYYDKFSSTVTLRVTFDNLGSMDAAVDAATAAAGNLGDIQLSSTNVSYTVSDCTALEKAAMQAAVEDARARGAAFAETIGVGLGSVTGASHYSYSPYGGSACGTGIVGPYPLGGAPYIESQSRVVQVFANISMTFAIA
jgi:uncharacterized protein YggE